MKKRGYIAIKYTDIKKKYHQHTDEIYRKRCGQFFTPGYIAGFMARWITDGKAKKILDPALGLGVFVDKLSNIIQRDITVYGYETDKKLLQLFQSSFQQQINNSVKMNLYNKDYLNDWGREYDGIICNPPYIIYKKYNNKRIQEVFRKKLGINLSGFCNLYIYFLVKSLTELKTQGRMAYILPLEFFNADYGIRVKEIIKNYGYLRFIIILNYRVFDAITTSAILLFANNNKNGEQRVKFVKVNNSNEFKNIVIEDEEDNKEKRILEKHDGARKDRERLSFLNDDLNPELKWQVYYHLTTHRDNHYRHLVKFSKYARVSRGIATGANDFFLFNKSKKEKFQIEDKYLLYCLPKASYISTCFFDYSHLNQLKDEDKYIFLLDVAPEDVKNDKYLSRYIRYGMEQGYHRRYLTRHRNPWYKLNYKQPPPVLVKTFNRKGFQFVLNEAGVNNLTSFHCIYLKDEKYTVLVKSYLLTDIADELFSKNKREYGNGLIKYEPNDLNNACIPDLTRIDSSSVKYISAIYKSFIEKTKAGQKTEREIKKINIIFKKIFKS